METKKYKVYAGGFAEKSKALKQAAKAKKIVSDSYITIENNLFIVNICEPYNKQAAETLKKALTKVGVDAKIKEA